MYFSTDTLEVSCSDCKLELIKKRWTQVLLNWINKCVNPTLKAEYLSTQWLVEIINKYIEDICGDDIDRAVLCTDDLEPFLRYKYPILRLRYFTDEKDNPKKIYIMTSVLLFHCCVSSVTGAVEEDICKKLARYEKEMILKFCESLGEMEITINNVDSAIKVACESVHEPKRKKKRAARKRSKAAAKNSNATTVSEDTSQASSKARLKKRKHVKKSSTLTFKSSVTVMSSCVTDSSSFSKTSSVETSDTYSMKLAEGNTSVDSNEVAIFNVVEKEERGEKPAVEGCGAVGIVKCEDNRREMVPIGETLPMMIPVVQEDPCTCLLCSSGDLCCELPDCSNCSKSSDKYLEKDPNHKKGGGKGEGGVEKGGKAGDGKKNKEEEEMGDKVKEKKVDGGKSIRSKGIGAIGDYIICKCRSLINDRIILWRICLLFFCLFIPCLLTGIVLFFTLTGTKKSSSMPDPHHEHHEYYEHDPYKHNVIHNNFDDESSSQQHIPVRYHSSWSWSCNNSLCIKILKTNQTDTFGIFSALSRCILTCMGPQIWPYPIGTTHYSKDIVALATNKLEYKFQSIPSDAVSQYLSEAFKLFLGDLARLERIDVHKGFRKSQDMEIKKMNIMIEVESDGDPRLRLNTDESYSLKLDTVEDKVRININSPSFCGVRHGLETLSQLILLDQSTGNLITLSHVVVKDAPSYKYRGIMLDTARNYIPVSDILRTIDGMASCKLNTFHWRITDSASFPLLIPTLSNLFEYGGYDRDMVYTKEDVKTIVDRAGVRGIRVLMEIALPGPVGRAWSWSDDASCPKKNDNFTCDNELCIRLKMKDSVFEVLQHIYAEVIAMTGVDDVFHMSDGVFSLSNCYYLIDEREGFLERALERLKLANKGFLPVLPIVWYTPHLNRGVEGKLWERYGVQVFEWPSQSDFSLGKYKVIHSSRWDLSCDVKKQRCTKYRSWQEMYAWKSWRTIEAFSIEGGESILWTDEVDAGNLDFHLWPRATAVAERLWSDLVINATATGSVYVRLDSHRWRMLLRGMKVMPIWPVYCSFNPNYCLSKLKHWGKNKI